MNHYKFLHHPFAVLYQVDLAFPGYGRDAPSFHWKYDAMIETLIRNNPPSSRRSKSQVEEDSKTQQQRLIGHRLLSRAQRKDIKKVHVPQGLVMQFEGELVNFLDQLTLSDDEDEGKDETEQPASEENDVTTNTQNNEVEKDASWVVVNKPDETTAAETEVSAVDAVEEETTAESSTPVQQPLADDQGLREPRSSSNGSDAAATPIAESNDESGPLQIYLRWDIQDQFLRFVAHALCKFYGLVSFSKTAIDGKRWLYVCHPAHLDSIGQLASPETSKQSSPIMSVSSAPTMAESTTTSSRPAPLKRQKTLEQVQELPVHELEQLWSQVEPCKVAVTMCPRPDMTFFEYLYPSTRPIC
ncbi:hypothetical protein BGZ83_006384 [Gryganskiella cystojenkinii]|nr:hypothetical protein BGZ83_006384 [Gryganskiella cystojenkinii]